MKKARVKIYIYFAILVLFLGSLAYFVLYSDFLKASKIEIQDSIFYERSNFLSELRTEIISSRKYLGFFDKKNILFWYFAADNIQNPKKFPSLKEINIDTNLASKSISFRVKENDLKGIVCKSRKECFGFNDSGVIYTKAPYVKGSLILKIDDNSKRQLVLGHRFLPEKEWIKRMLETISMLKENGFHIKSAYLKPIDLREWGINLFSGPDLYFSFDFIPERLNQVLTNFFQKFDEDNLEYIDLRVPGRIYYR